MADSDFTPTIQSRFHGAFNEIARLNFLWQECNTLSSSGRLVKWRWKLDAIWRELSASAFRLDENKAKDKKSWAEQIEEIDKTILSARTRNEIYKSLGKKEEMLRLIQDASGKGTSWTDDSESGFF
jgi:ABC-type uncharacterized transport system substrate-binding protein